MPACYIRRRAVPNGKGVCVCVQIMKLSKTRKKRRRVMYDVCMDDDDDDDDDNDNARPGLLPHVLGFPKAQTLRRFGRHLRLRTGPFPVSQSIQDRKTLVNTMKK